MAGQCLSIINMGTKGKSGCPDMALIGKRALWPFACGLAKAFAGMEITYEDNGQPVGVPDWKAFEETAPKAWECLKWEDPANRPNVDGLYDAMVASQVLVWVIAEGLVN